MVILKEENRRLFGEQVNDHIEKLNDLMSLSSGAAFGDQAIRRACLATRLLEGSTRMLGLDGWSRTLKSFRELLESAAGAGRRWDEQLSQIVSEVLETEEQVVAEILAGEAEEVSRHERFDGLIKEIECLATEPPAPAPEAVSLEEEAPAPDAREREETVPAPLPETGEHVPTFTRLITTLTETQGIFQEILDTSDRGDKSLRELEIAFGESEFYMGLAAETLRRLGKSSKPFTAKIPCQVVLDGIKDFFGTFQRLGRWNARLASRCADCVLDRDSAATLASLLNGCVFDICRRYEVRDDVSLAIGIDIRSEGSFVVANVQDNGPDYLCDSEIDRDDAGAFYPSFRDMRGRIQQFGSLLWLEPGGGNNGRFMFTLPRTRTKTDYHVFTASGKRLAVPCHAIDSTLPMTAVETARGTGMRHVVVAGTRVPAYAIQEIAIEDEFEVRGEPDRALVVGLAEKRIALLVSGQGRTIECLADQVTKGPWASLAGSVLNLGEEEIPIIDVGMVLGVASSLQGTEGGPEEAGTYADGGQVNDQEATVPRA